MANFEPGSWVWVPDAEDAFPEDPNETTDTDGDGIGDNAETNTGIYLSPTDTGTDPENADSDGDGLSDSSETNTGSYASSVDTGTDPGNADTDGDGINDGDEYNAGSDPTNASDPAVSVPGLTPTALSLLLALLLGLGAVHPRVRSKTGRTGPV